jgi:hypothetical protein
MQLPRWTAIHLSNTTKHFLFHYNSRDKDPIKAIHFSSSNLIFHAFDLDEKNGQDLLIGLNSRNVYSVSLRQPLEDPGGEDDLVQVWSMEDHVVVAWGEGHNS